MQNRSDTDQESLNYHLVVPMLDVCYDCMSIAELPILKPSHLGNSGGSCRRHEENIAVFYLPITTP